MKQLALPRWFWFSAGVALLCGLGYLAFHALFVKVKTTVEQPWSGPAARNEYYVLQRYLEQRQLTVKTVRSWPQPLGADSVVFWMSSEPIPEELRTWLAKGGQLWAPLDPDASAESRAAWEATPWPGEQPEADEDEVDDEQVADDATGAEPPVADVDASAALDALEDELEAEEAAAEAQEQKEEYEAEEAEDEASEIDYAALICPDGCLTAAQFHYGEGCLTLVRTLGLENERVSRGETPARIDALLASCGKRTRSVLIVARFDSPWFGKLLLEHAPEALLALAVLLVLWLWRAGTHFGATRPAQQRERRRMLEHISAVGVLAGRVGLGPLLLAARRELLRRLLRRVAQAGSLQGEALVTSVVAATELPTEQVKRALLDPPSGGGKDALDIARAIQALWRRT